ncbi:hypothetical protein CDCA_CDCA01G0085 [Cyanidium caldarium]|uniref:Proteasome subunit alpha type n=1 Tax=Cyanidium caldarium TaxID=2771 RepID=A0AAV9IPP6_CYACA|nr:hypothetical protein CDCA_CDCA01G0085 [Cyanidium caldarium]
MAGVGSGYDLSTTTFSPEGRVFQLEYANKAVELSGTVVGVVCRDAVVLAVENVLPHRFVVSGTLRRVHTVDRHVAIAVGGMGPDGRHLVARARSEAENYRAVYGEAIPARVLADRVAGYAHLYSLYWHVRPFGCTAVIGAWDAVVGAVLYAVEPDGSVYKYRAYAHGKGRTAVRTELDKVRWAERERAEAMREVAGVVERSRDVVKDKPYELEMVVVGERGVERIDRFTAAESGGERSGGGDD